MSGQEQSGDKNFDPTPQKLEEARRKGDVARSMDLAAAGAFLGLFLGLLSLGAAALEDTARLLSFPFAQNDRLIGAFLGFGSGDVVGDYLGQLATAFAPVVAFPFAFALVANCPR